MRGPGTSALVLATTVVIAGCGGGGGTKVDTAAEPAANPSAAATTTAAAGSDNAKAITALVDTIMAAKDPAAICQNSFTAGMVTTTFGSQSACTAEGGNGQGDDGGATKATVASVKVSGTTATATVTDANGDSKGATGTWTFRLVDKAWRLDEWGIDYLRSVTKITFGPDYQGETGDPLNNAAYRLCISKAMLAKDDAAFRTFAYALMSERPTGLGQVFASCASKGPGGESPFRAEVEKDLKEGFARVGVSSSVSKCIITKTRSIDEAELIDGAMAGPTSEAYKALMQKVQVFAAACGGKSGSAASIRPKGIVRPHFRVH